MEIKTKEDFATALNNGPYAWPGGYPLYFITNDGGCLSFKAAVENKSIIQQSIEEALNDGWWVVAVEVNWEDTIYCDHTGEVIESAYGADDDDLA
jgi:hypothetical protein